MSNSILEVGADIKIASAATESAAEFIKMYHSVTPHEFNLLRPNEIQVDTRQTPSLLVPIGEENLTSKEGVYQHEDLNVNSMNKEVGDPGSVPVTKLLPPPPPPPPLVLSPKVGIPPLTQSTIASASAASINLANDLNETANTKINENVDVTLNESADTTIVNEIPNNNLSNAWPNRYGKQPSPIFGVIDNSLAIKNQLKKSHSSVEIPALTLNPITNLPQSAYGSEIKWEKRAPITFSNSWPLRPAMTLNPINNMPIVKPNNAPPAQTMRSLVPLPASMSAAVANSASASLWHNPPNTPVNFNGQMPQPQWYSRNNHSSITPWNYHHFSNVYQSNIPYSLSPPHHNSHLQQLPVQISQINQGLPPPALTWNSTPITNDYQFQYQHGPFGYGFGHENNNRLAPPSFTSFIAAQRPTITWNPSQSWSRSFPHFSGQFHHIGPPPFAAARTMSYSASAWNPDTSRVAQVYGSATKVWQDGRKFSASNHGSNLTLPPPGQTLPTKYVVVTSQQAPTKSSLVKKSSSPNTATSPTNNTRSVTFQEAVVNINDEENQRPKSVLSNLDPNNLEIIKKRNPHTVHYTQNVSLKFLKPPSPPTPGDITIQQQPDVQAPSLSPILIQQKPTKAPVKPPPQVIRERPPAPPSPIPPVVVTIPGRVLPPPPRKVIVEKLPELPPLPRDITVERWLGYNKRSRRIKYEPAPKLALAPKPKNVLIEWDTPKSIVERGFTFLGIVECDPNEYVARYGPQLTAPQNLPPIAYEANFKPPPNETFGFNYRPDEPNLVGDLNALRFINFNPNVNTTVSTVANHSNIFPHHTIRLNNLPAITAY